MLSSLAIWQGIWQIYFLLSDNFPHWFPEKIHQFVIPPILNISLLPQLHQFLLIIVFLILPIILGNEGILKEFWFSFLEFLRIMNTFEVFLSHFYFIGELSIQIYSPFLIGWYVSWLFLLLLLFVYSAY